MLRERIPAMTVFLLFMICCFIADAKVTQTKQKPKTEKRSLNYDILPPLEDVLDELEMKERLSGFVKMGVTETRILVLLKKMDFHMMMLEWEGFNESDVKRLQDKIQDLISMATVEVESIREDLIERRSLKYGRLYLSNFVQSFEYLLASFGGIPPVGPLPVVLANPLHGCVIPNNPKDYSGTLVFVIRGECTFLEKSLMMQKVNASVIAVINNEDRLESAAAGFGQHENITDQLLKSLTNITIITSSNTTLAPILFTLQKDQNQKLQRLHQKSSIYANVVPLKCGAKTVCKSVIPEEQQLHSEITSGQLRLQYGQETRSFDFLTSTFGGALPLQTLRLFEANPQEACEPLVPISDLDETLDKSDHLAFVVMRGGCSFDVKASVAEKAGASLMIIIDKNDSALQRLGGKQPLAGAVGIPSIMVSNDAGKFILEAVHSAASTSSSSSPPHENPKPFVKLHPSDNDVIADNWIELAYTEWEAEDENQLAQIEGLLHKYANNHPSNDITSWLKRRAYMLKTKNMRTVVTDEL